MFTCPHNRSPAPKLASRMPDRQPAAAWLHTSLTNRSMDRRFVDCKKVLRRVGSGGRTHSPVLLQDICLFSGTCFLDVVSYAYLP